MITRDIDRLNSFVIEHKNMVSEFDISQFKNKLSMVTESFVNTWMIHRGRDIYSSYIDNTITSLKEVSLDLNSIIEFITAIYKGTSLEAANITIPLQSDEGIEKIRPEYLMNVATQFNADVTEILRGNLKKGDIKKKYVSGDYFDKVKRQLVKSSLTVSNTKDLMKLNSPTIMKVDTIFLQNTALPFLKSAVQDVKDMTILSINTKGRINESYTQIEDTINSIDKMKESGKLTHKMIDTLDYYEYNMLRQFMNLCAYLSAMVIRKSLYYSYNIMAYNNLIGTIRNHFPEEEDILHESVMNCDLTDMEDSELFKSAITDELKIVIPHIQLLVGKQKMFIANYISKKFNIKMNYTSDINIDKYPYDTTPYTAVHKTLIDIYRNIKSFENGLKEPELVVDDLLKDTTLDSSFIEKYSNVLSNIDNVEYYTVQMKTDLESDGSVTMSLYNDIDKFEVNVRTISRNLGKIYNTINTLYEEFSHNEINLDTPTFDELKSSLEMILVNYKEYVLQVAKKLMRRLDNLIDVLNDMEIPNTTEPEEYIPYDYSFEAYNETYNDIEEYEKTIFESLLRDYNSQKAEKTRGVKLVYEDVEETKTEDNKTTPEVEVSDNNSNNNQSSSNSNNSNDSSDKTEKKKSLIRRFIDWLKSIFGKHENKTDQLAKANEAFIKTVKEKRLRNYQTGGKKIKITLAPYPDLTSEQISRDINHASGKIAAINPSNIPNELKKGKDKACEYLFPGIKSATMDGENNFTSSIKYKYTYGTKSHGKLVTYTNEDAAKKISEIVDFCEDYRETAKSISKALDKLGEVAANKQEELIDAESTVNRATGNNMNESTAVFEFKHTGDVKIGHSKIKGEEDSSTTSAMLITQPCREYTGAILTVYEKKYLDYMKVLRKLFPDVNDDDDEEE